MHAGPLPGFQCYMYRIAGNFRGRKPSRILRFESHLRKISREIWGRAAPTYDWFQAIHESFLREILTSYESAKVFSLKSLPLYGIKGCMGMSWGQGCTPSMNVYTPAIEF